jgi:isopentenyl-diphosphate delta-isomerase
MRYLNLAGRSSFMRDIERRKKEHVDVCLRGSVEYGKGSGFEDVEFVHNALPELDLGEVDIKARLFGKKLEAPMFIEPITGGYREAGKINKRLALAAEEEGVVFCVGSQRAMIEDRRLKETYYVRDVAPNAVVIGNIGIAQLKKGNLKKIEEAVQSIEADGLSIHLNALQEAVQEGGDRNFKGCLRAIEEACDRFPFPLIVKETGGGMSAGVASKLKEAGVSLVDVAGAGGTSWSKVEYRRGRGVPGFDEWGVPTVQSIVLCSSLLKVIASGGIRNGIDLAKGIALGADFGGAALPFVLSKNPRKEIGLWKEQMRIAMFLVGAKNLGELKRAKLLVTGRTAEELLLHGIDIGRFAKR